MGRTSKEKIIAEASPIFVKVCDALENQPLYVYRTVSDWLRAAIVRIENADLSGRCRRTKQELSKGK